MYSSSEDEVQFARYSASFKSPLISHVIPLSIISHPPPSPPPKKYIHEEDWKKNEIVCSKKKKKKKERLKKFTHENLIFIKNIYHLFQRARINIKETKRLLRTK